MSDELWRRSATELAAAIRRREVSCVEVMQAHLARIEAVNPLLNAIVTLDAELGLREAAAADAALGRGEAPGPLHGLPMAIKDLEDTEGMRTTYGSPIYRDHVPTADTLMVARLRARRRHRRRQDQHARVRRRLADLQPRLRHDPQPVRPRAHAGRQQRRRGRRGRQRHAPVRRRVGSRREHPQPRVLLQPRRAAHRSRARAGGAVGQRVEPDGRPRAAGAQRRGRRAAAAGDGRPRPARAAVARRSAAGLGARRGRRSARRAHRLESQPRRPPGRARGDRRAGGRTARRSRRWAASSRTSSRTSRRPTTPSRSCAPSATRRPSGRCSSPTPTG